MKRFFLILAIAVVMTALTDAKAYAAPAVEDPLDNIELPSVLQKTFAGYYHFIEPSTGDTLAMVVFNPIIRNFKCYIIRVLGVFSAYKTQKMSTFQEIDKRILSGRGNTKFISKMKHPAL